MVLVGVLAAIGIPSFQALTQSTEARDGVESLASGFMSARATAVNTGVSVKICAVAAGGSGCSASPADWATAWTVFQAKLPGPPFTEVVVSVTRSSEESLAQPHLGRLRRVPLLPETLINSVTS